MRFAPQFDGAGTPCGGTSYGMEVVIDNLMLKFDGQAFLPGSCPQAPSSVIVGAGWEPTCAGAPNGSVCIAKCTPAEDYLGTGYSITCTNGVWGGQSGRCRLKGECQPAFVSVYSNY
jgi:hypothetical protein